MESILAFFRRMLGLEQSVERIMSPITKIVNKLDAHSAAQQLAAQKATENAARSLAEADARRQEALLASSFKKALPAVGKSL
ncbi:hypothetical protein NKH72_22085 [Mesorhizobium sp. M0955]|uniref:hypothetical protein n=1 Tax=Mesorhizobium sp. M0955 TaxID=2957033 RepID=UPI003336C1DC